MMNTARHINPARSWLTRMVEPKHSASTDRSIRLTEAPELRGIVRDLAKKRLTRAQRMVILVGREDVIRTMVDNNRQTLRYTGLPMRLKRS